MFLIYTSQLLLKDLNEMAQLGMLALKGIFPLVSPVVSYITNVPA